MTSICKFVDSIAAAPTTRFDFNAGICDLQKEGTFIGSPPLNRAMAANAMSDGGFISSSAYGLRTITLHALFRGAADVVTPVVQTLMRELDRADNFLMWHPNGATKPVFFRTFRSAPDQFDMTEQSVDVWRVRVTLLAEPFALGLRETLGPFTVNNDPAAGSNGLFFDVTGVIGDVAAPALLVDSSRSASIFWLAVRQHGTPSDMIFFIQAESTGTPGIDTANPGGGPDANLSGAGTNNFLRTTYTSASDNPRVTWSPAPTAAQERAMAGKYRMLVGVRRSDATSVITVRFTYLTQSGPTVTVPLSTNRQIVDLGPISIAELTETGYVALENSRDVNAMTLRSQRVSGTGNLDWDFIFLLPADESCLVANWGFPSSTSYDLVIDGVKQDLWAVLSGDPLAGSAHRSAGLHSVAGGFPTVVPNQTNRFFYLQADAASGITAWTKSDTATVNVHYWPRYLYVRPSAT